MRSVELRQPPDALGHNPTRARAHVGQLCWPQQCTVEFAPIARRVSLHPAPQPPRTPQNTQCLHCARTTGNGVRLPALALYADINTGLRKKTSTAHGGRPLVVGGFVGPGSLPAMMSAISKHWSCRLERKAGPFQKPARRVALAAGQNPFRPYSQTVLHGAPRACCGICCSSPPRFGRCPRQW